MKKWLITPGLSVITSILSYYMPSLDYILGIIILLSLIFLAIIGLVSIFKKLHVNIYLTPLILVIISIIGLFTSLFRPYKPAVIDSKNVSENLEYAYTTDQDDRKELKSYISYFSKLKQRDDERLDQAKHCYEHDKLSQSMDFFHAAFIFHHSDTNEDYKIASRLAAKAAADPELKDNYLVQWLRKASYDRWMRSTGRPERYNTQDKFSIELQ